jgi:hypothetical protein
MSLAGGTSVACADDGHEWRLHRGDLSLEVAPQPHEHPLVIATGTARAVVQGTRLRVATDGRSTLLEVLSGSVSFARADEAAGVRVAAGEYAIADGRGPLLAMALPAPQAGVLYDAEGGLKPPECATGLVVAGPPRPSSRWCFQGEPLVQYPGWRYVVLYEYTKGHFTVAADSVLTFAYYLEPDADPGVLGLYLYSREQDADYKALLPHPVQGSWARAAIPLAELIPAGDRGELFRRPAPGDVVTSFNISARTVRGFFIDDIAIGPPPAP